MPIPKPKKNEKRNDFIQRCMIDPIMIKEYKNADQRLAVCAKTYRNEQETSTT
jgi:hypothetical protein